MPRQAVHVRFVRIYGTKKETLVHRISSSTTAATQKLTPTPNGGESIHFLCPTQFQDYTIVAHNLKKKRNVSGTLCKLIAVAGVGINQSYLFDVRLGERVGPGLMSNRLHKLGRQKVHDDMVGMLLLLVQLVSA